MLWRTCTRSSRRRHHRSALYCDNPHLQVKTIIQDHCSSCIDHLYATGSYRYALKIWKTLYHLHAMYILIFQRFHGAFELKTHKCVDFSPLLQDRNPLQMRMIYQHKCVDCTDRTKTDGTIRAKPANSVKWHEGTLYLDDNCIPIVRWLFEQKNFKGASLSSTQILIAHYMVFMLSFTEYTMNRDA